ncbi:winged helix-turn-helix domain-containing protein [Streptomyces sp. NPDC092129]|uniref:winged helix-turn-helix domain-containing protein n=1 Tax=Streptomyces sp. NPDC092129 TaxID=3366010 RepID=UPI0038041961
MTTALPDQAGPYDQLLSDPRHLHLVGDTAHSATPQDTPALVGYLLLVPEGTDPAELFVTDRPRPDIRPLLTTNSAPSPQATSDGIRIDPTRHVAEVDGRELNLTYLEFALLAHLIEHPHHVQTRDQLVTAVWGYDHVGDGRTVDVHIARLRRKLGEAHRRRIVTVRRMGYKYVPAR